MPGSRRRRKAAVITAGLTAASIGTLGLNAAGALPFAHASSKMFACYSDKTGARYHSTAARCPTGSMGPQGILAQQAQGPRGAQAPQASAANPVALQQKATYPAGKGPIVKTTPTVVDIFREASALPLSTAISTLWRLRQP